MTQRNTTPQIDEGLAVRPLGRRQLAELVGNGMERGDAEHSAGAANGQTGNCVCSYHAWLPEFCGEGG